MKYKHFILLRNTIIVVAVVGGLLLLGKWIKKDKEPTLATTTQTTDSHNTPPPAPQQDVTTPSNNNNATNTGSSYTLTTDATITKVHEEIMSIQKNTPMSEGKPDDNNGGLKLFKKFPTYQMDLRCDKAKGFDYWNRVKIDWDYDKKWDEKWDFRKNGSIKRQCATNDDEQYNVVLETVEGKWVKK